MKISQKNLFILTVLVFLLNCIPVFAQQPSEEMGLFQYLTRKWSNGKLSGPGGFHNITWPISARRLTRCRGFRSETAKWAFCSGAKIQK